MISEGDTEDWNNDHHRMNKLLFNLFLYFCTNAALGSLRDFFTYRPQVFEQ